MKHSQKLQWLFVALFFLCSATATFSQSLKSVFTDSESPLTYLGIDFTKNKLLDIGNPDDIRNRIYGSINDLTVNEPKNYDFMGAFHKSKVDNDLSAVKKSNAKININDILSTNQDDYNRLKESDIASVVKGLDLSGKSGVGFLFVYEAMRKIDKKSTAAIWATFVDMKTKKVLLTERMEVIPAGFGFRNFWASGIKKVLKEIEKNKFAEWKSKHGS
ncbi:MAG: hypothetical protein ABL929_01040 [Ferruginibacter sp.]|nr:hypothetical protein [Ferruginibacter sp.]